MVVCVTTISPARRHPLQQHKSRRLCVDLGFTLILGAMTATTAPSIYKQTAGSHRHALQGIDAAETDTAPEAYVAATRATFQVLSACMALPFDITRERYARAVRAGLIERSLLASAQFGLGVTAMERLALGPWARRP